MKMPLLLMLSLLFSYAPAQLIFQELFEVEPPDDRGILANVNGWSSSWNSADESLARLVETNLTWEAPFAARGRAIQIVNSRSTAFRELPEELNGQTVYFSFLFRFFQEEGGTGQLRFRSDAGHVIAVGFTDGQFHVQAQNERTNWGRVRDRENYFVVGRLIISEDGRSVDIEMSAYTQRAAIPMDSPERMEGGVVHQGIPRRWNGVEFMAASQSVVFDDLRIGRTWRDVTGTRR